MPPSPHITADSLVHELTQSWGSRGVTAYKTALIGADVVLKKSGWTGIAIKISHTPQSTTLLFNSFAPSFLVRMFAMGLIPVLILNPTAWKPFLREFRGYLEGAPFFRGQLGGHGHAPQMGAPPGYAQLPPGAPQQGYGAPPSQQGYGAPHKATAARNKATGLRSKVTAPRLRKATGLRNKATAPRLRKATAARSKATAVHRRAALPSSTLATAARRGRRGPTGLRSGRSCASAGLPSGLREWLAAGRGQQGR